ncbi:hypothetical protein EBU99_08910 [bacterium]|nr:hypothetical protein [bacterium]
MSRNRSALFLVAIGSAVLGGIASQIFRDSSQDPANATTLNRKTDPGRPPKPLWRAGIGEVEVPKSEVKVVAKLSPTPKPSLENPPLIKQIREEVAQDPHATPQALLAFAEQLAVNMQGAFQDREVRYNVSRQLMACARDGQARGSAQAARALCLSNLERLKSKFPDELAPSYQSLVAELPDDLLFVAGVSKTTEEK